MRKSTTFIRQARLTAPAVVAGLFILGGSGFAQTPSPDFAHFTYDRSARLNVKQVSARVQDGVTIEDITYTGANGDTVPAYLVIPKGAGKFACILWGHWLMDGAANSNRGEFLEEAVALAPSGVVSLLIDAPQIRPNFKPLPGSGPNLGAQQVVDLRRGLDLLLSRPDIDAARTAYVGHSFDAATGAILDATDKRFAAFVFMGGPRKLDMAKENAWADPGHYAGKLGPAPALFQYGLHDDEFVPVAAAKDYVAKASGLKTVKFYDAGHALNAKARTDRDRFLRKTLRLNP
ncbi:MAG: alpha/beta hydrolase family protein [Rhizomicrobium sp.]